MATYALTEKAVVLRSEDDVAIAKREMPAGTVLEDAAGRIEVAAGHQARPQGRAPRRASGRRGAPLWAGHRLRHRRHRGRRPRSHAEPRQSATCAPRLRVRHGRASGRLLSAPRSMRYLRRLQARRRPGRDAQLRRDHLRRQLLGEREPVRQGQVPRRAEGLPEHRRRPRHHAQVGLRHQALRRGPHGARSACSPATPSTRTWPRTS